MGRSPFMARRWQPRPRNLRATAIFIFESMIRPLGGKRSRGSSKPVTQSDSDLNAFHGETLAAAAEEFARYSDIHIRIDDPTVGREKITGLFQAGDPIGFSHAVAVSFDLRVQVIDDEIRISRD